jgi:hypothetical protein
MGKKKRKEKEERKRQRQRQPNPVQVQHQQHKQTLMLVFACFALSDVSVQGLCSHLFGFINR